MTMIITEKITLWGIVQGVGFRPFVAKTADRLGMNGSVRNTGGLVEIFVKDTKERIDEFVTAVEIGKPEPSEIVHIKREIVTEADIGEGFTILGSCEGDDEVAMIPADIAVCPDCLSEMRDPSDPRFGHPMISCMVCGPRYTITDRFPYDRENTSMDDFPMCESCRSEYTSSSDRRYHAQTISCHTCGPYLELRYRDEYGRLNEITERNDGSKIISICCDMLKNGKVIAFKSMGGYNLVCDPFNSDAVSELRGIKHREAKPFAVMFSGPEEIRKYCLMSDAEERLISSSARPIILLERRSDVEVSSELERSRFIGAFLPSMGAQYLLLERFGGPLIVTSANVSSMPMVKDDDAIFSMMDKESRINAALYNERRIRIRMDDSVARIIDGQPQMIRRSKGYAPVPLYIEEGEKAPQIFATGGQLKNSFAISRDGYVYVSQYFGDMDSQASQEIYDENVKRMCDMFRIDPETAVCDMHPLYFTTGYAEKYAKKTGCRRLMVQHHHAHVASVIAEHNLKGPVIGVSFDGTGYGTDGAVWGGEFLLCEGGDFTREAHLKYIEMTGGDESMRDGAKSAVCYRYAWEHGYQDTEPSEIAVDLSEIFSYCDREDVFLKPKGEEDLIKAAVSNHINTVRSSSMGRLFDAVSALLGICAYSSYEGECAILLEDAADRALKNRNASESDRLALSFHMKIRDIVLAECIKIRNEKGVNEVALTGGVFQNKILMESTLSVLRENGFKVSYNISVSPNDGGIALGQTYIAAMGGGMEI